jgi:hypothetical protein
MVMPLRTWQHYLLGNVVHIYREHKSLKYIFTHPDLNMRQRRWLELINDYELEVHYHSGKADVVVNAPSCKAHCNYLLVVHVTWRYSIHPGCTKMYHDIRQQFLWTRMKRETTRYVSKCDYMKPGGLLQPLSILDWK